MTRDQSRRNWWDLLLVFLVLLVFLLVLRFLLWLGCFVLSGSYFFSFVGSWLLTAVTSLRLILFLHERFVLPGLTDCWHESSCKNQVDGKDSYRTRLYSDLCAQKCPKYFEQTGLIEIHRFEHHMLLLKQHVWTLDQMAEVEAWPSTQSHRHGWTLAPWMGFLWRSARTVMRWWFWWGPNTKVAFFIFSLALAHHLRNWELKKQEKEIGSSEHWLWFWITLRFSICHRISFQPWSKVTCLPLCNLLLE